MADNKKSTAADIASQLIELEEKIMFQQRTIDELNSVVLSQQSELTRLAREFESLRSQMRGLADGGLGEDLPHEKPPHY